MRVRMTEVHGNTRWVVDYKDGRGKRHRKFFKTPEEAREFANTTTEGTPKEKDGPSTGIRRLFNQFLHLTRARRGDNFQRDLTYRLRLLADTLEQMGYEYVNDLDHGTFPELIAALKADGYAEATIDSYARSFRSAIKWAQDKSLIGDDQVGDMSLTKPQKQRLVYLTKSEIDRLLDHTEGHWIQLPVALGVYQGLRRSEVCNLRGEDLDLDGNRLTVRHSKNRDWRVIQLHARLHDYLCGPVPDGAEHVCRNKSGDRLAALLAEALHRPSGRGAASRKSASARAPPHRCGGESPPPTPSRGWELCPGKSTGQI